MHCSRNEAAKLREEFLDIVFGHGRREVGDRNFCRPIVRSQLISGWTVSGSNGAGSGLEIGSVISLLDPTKPLTIWV